MRRLGSGTPIVQQVLSAVAALVAVTAPLCAEWVPCDLPFGDFLDQPVTAVSAPADGCVWALTTYSYHWQDEQHVRWNTALYRSRNEGLLWNLAFDGDYADAVPVLHAAFKDVTLYGMAFRDAEHGWLAGVRRPAPYAADGPPGDYVFLSTGDGGRSWNSVSLPNNDPAPVSPGSCVLAVTPDGGVLAGMGKRLFEFGDGAGWRQRPGPWPVFHDIEAAGAPEPWFAGDDGAGAGLAGRIGGDGPVVLLTAPGSCVAVRFGDDGTGLVSSWDGLSGRIHRTEDGGWTWTVVLTVPGVVIRSFAWAGAGVWAFGGGEDGSAGVVYRSGDRGVTWAAFTATGTAIRTAAFRDPAHGFAGAGGGVLRYVPLEGDIDGDGAVTAGDVRLLLRRAAGLEEGDGALVDAVCALRQSLGCRRLFRPFCDPDGVVVVYNTQAPDADGDGVGDSLQVARHYALRRGVPSRNLLGVAAPLSEGFEARAFDAGGGRANWADAYNSVVAALKAHIEALGRNSVNAIVLCRGLPYRFATAMPDGVVDTQSLDAAFSDLWRTDAANWSSWQPYAAPSNTLAARYGMPRFEGVGRPLGQPAADATGRTTRDPTYVVSRLDGPSLESVLAMVDNAVFAEQHHGPAGYTGTAYVDTRASRFGRPPYPLEELRSFLPSFASYGDMDRSIAKTILSFADRGYPWRDEVTSSSIGGPPVDEAVNGPVWRDGAPAVSAPRAMFYAGWYNPAQYFDVWDWLPGSVGVDYNSASAFALRGHPTVPYWAPGALGRGLTALLGVIAEPYVYHPAPDVLMEYLAKGYSFGEAATLSTPRPRTAKPLVVGDPLYRPFAGGGVPVPVPALTVSARPDADGWTVTVETDVPSRLTLRYTTDGSEPSGASQAVSGPPFFARRASFKAPTASARYVVEAVDPVGRTTRTKSATLAR
jgi:uncharacterized protein (TIGR03790 family)